MSNTHDNSDNDRLLRLARLYAATDRNGKFRAYPEEGIVIGVGGMSKDLMKKSLNFNDSCAI